MIASKRISLIKRDGLEIELEYNESYAILHLPQLKMTKTNYLEFMTVVPDIHKFMTTVGYEAIWTGIDPEDSKTRKLLERLGATKLGTAQGIDVYEYRGEQN